MKNIFKISLVTVALFSPLALAKVPDELKGLWKIESVDSNASNMSSLQPCIGCFDKMFLSFEDSEAWTLKGKCQDPLYELRSIKFSDLKKNVYSGNDLKDQLTADEKFKLDALANEMVSFISIKCGKDKKVVIPDAANTSSSGDEVWIVLRKNGELLAETGYSGRYSAKITAETSAASFDCTKAKLPDELAICKTPILRAWDKKMAEVYKGTIIFAKGPDGDKKCPDSLKKKQLAWNKKKKACKSLESCLYEEMRERVEELLDQGRLCPME